MSGGVPAGELSYAFPAASHRRSHGPRRPAPETGECEVSTLRTHNRRRLRAQRRIPIQCPKHRVSIRGAGWAYAAGLRFAVFACPKPGCAHTKLFGDRNQQPISNDGEMW